MAMMALLLGDGAAAGVDAARCLRMALVHDAAEAIVGDITPHCGVSEEDKHAREAAAIARMQGMLGGQTHAGAWRRACLACEKSINFFLQKPTTKQQQQNHPPIKARDLGALWAEYEAQATPEARLVKDFDKLEMVLQAAEYEAAQGLDLQQFFDSTDGRFTTPTGKAWAAEIAALRQQARQQTPAAPGDDGKQAS
jgi:putative hydrolase of HD superfamily